jgi:hypothetical protein
MMEEWPSNIGEDGLKFVQFNREDSKCKIVDENAEGICELFQSFRFWNEFNQKYGFNLIRGIPI